MKPITKISEPAISFLLKSISIFVVILLSNFSLLSQNVGIGTTKPPIAKLHVQGTVRAERNSNANAPHVQLHETEYDYSRLKFSNDNTGTYFSLEGRPAIDSSQAKFNLYNSHFGNIFTGTAAGRFGINTDSPAATFHVDGVIGFDPIRIQNANATKFRIFSNNAIVLGSNWQTPIANVIRVVTPNMFIGFDGNHVPTYRLEVDGHVKMSKLVISQLAQEGRVLTSSAAGIGTWQDPQGDADADPTNEIQTISESLGTVTLSDGGGSFVDSVKDADADPTNEIQSISKSFGTVTLSDGGGTFFDEVNDNDADPTNEIQNLSLLGNSLSLSSGNSVKLSTIADPAGRELVETNRNATYPQIALDIDATESFVFNRKNGISSLAFLNSSNNIDIKTRKNGNIISGFDNVAIGRNTFESVISGDENIILGKHADTEFSGDGNILIGTYAGEESNNYFGNINIGERAGYLASGNSNISIGNNAGYVGEGLSIYIGKSAGTSSSGGGARAICIGYNTVNSGSDQVRIGNANTTSIGGYQPWTNLSDGRFKQNVAANVPGLQFINKLKPVTYHLDGKSAEIFIRGQKEFEKLDEEYKQSLSRRNVKVESGFIAQEVEKAAQSLGYDFNGVVPPQNEKDPYSLAYSQFVVPLVQAVQELDEKNQVLEKTNQNLVNELALLRSEIEIIKKVIKEKK